MLNFDSNTAHKDAFNIELSNLSEFLRSELVKLEKNKNEVGQKRLSAIVSFISSVSIQINQSFYLTPKQILRLSQIVTLAIKLSQTNNSDILSKSLSTMGQTATAEEDVVFINDALSSDPENNRDFLFARLSHRLAAKKFGPLINISEIPDSNLINKINLGDNSNNESKTAINANKKSPLASFGGQFVRTATKSLFNDNISPIIKNNYDNSNVISSLQSTKSVDKLDIAMSRNEFIQMIKKSLENSKDDFIKTVMKTLESRDNIETEIVKQLVSGCIENIDVMMRQNIQMLNETIAKNLLSTVSNTLSIKLKELAKEQNHQTAELIKELATQNLTSEPQGKLNIEEILNEKVETIIKEIHVLKIETQLAAKKVKEKEGEAPDRDYNQQEKILELKEHYEQQLAEKDLQFQVYEQNMKTIQRSLEDKIAVLEESLNQSDNKIQSYKTTLRTAANEIENLTAKLEQMSNEGCASIQSHKTEIDELKAKMAEVQEEKNVMEKRYEILSEQYSKLSKKFDENLINHDEKTTELKEQQNFETNSLKAKIVELNKQIMTMKTQAEKEKYAKEEEKMTTEQKETPEIIKIMYEYIRLCLKIIGHSFDSSNLDAESMKIEYKDCFDKGSEQKNSDNDCLDENLLSTEEWVPPENVIVRCENKMDEVTQSNKYYSLLKRTIDAVLSDFCNLKRNNEELFEQITELKRSNNKRNKLTDEIYITDDEKRKEKLDIGKKKKENSYNSREDHGSDSYANSYRNYLNAEPLDEADLIENNEKQPRKLSKHLSARDEIREDIHKEEEANTEEDEELKLIEEEEDHKFKLSAANTEDNLEDAISTGPKLGSGLNSNEEVYDPTTQTLDIKKDNSNTRKKDILLQTPSFSTSPLSLKQSKDSKQLQNTDLAEKVGMLASLHSQLKETPDLSDLGSIQSLKDSGTCTETLGTPILKVLSSMANVESRSNHQQKNDIENISDIAPNSNKNNNNGANTLTNKENKIPTTNISLLESISGNAAPFSFTTMPNPVRKTDNTLIKQKNDNAKNKIFIENDKQNLQKPSYERNTSNQKSTKHQPLVSNESQDEYYDDYYYYSSYYDDDELEQIKPNVQGPSRIKDFQPSLVVKQQAYNATGKKTSQIPSSDSILQGNKRIINDHLQNVVGDDGTSLQNSIGDVANEALYKILIQGKNIRK